LWVVGSDEVDEWVVGRREWWLWAVSGGKVEWVVGNGWWQGREKQSVK
jgi:hypothetical protein